MTALDRLIEADAIDRLRDRDASLFTTDLDTRMPIVQRLGWTDLAGKALGRAPLLDSLADALIAEKITDILLLGMGGSSLAPLVMSRVIGSADGFPKLHVLDTTSPTQVTDTLASLDPAHTFVLVASKSGTTIEPMSLYAIVRAWLEADGTTRAESGRRCAVITDQGTPLEKIRQRDLMRTALSAPATVGGRYSALSMFGLAPAALIGIHLPTFVGRAQAMEDACAAPAAENPGALLAAWIADAAEAGRDKLTLAFSERFVPLGLWIEQLVAESLGKDGRGVVPVIEYEPFSATGYGDDRAVVVVRFTDDDALSAWSREIAASHPVFELTVTDVFDLAAEFVRWEFATALAGFLLGVNPFDEPAVTEAKVATTRILEGGAEEVPTAQAELAGTWVTYAGGLTPPTSPPADRRSAMRIAVEAAGPADYLAVLAYLPEDEERLAPLRAAVAELSRATGRAAMLELGPRYLHSTGQLHKGGPNTGVFILVTARDRVDLEIPGKRFGLAALHRAQAEGDLVTLARHGRRVLRLDLPTSGVSDVEALAADLADAAR
ncbi:MAG: glucose-6-phosphate isomerase [Coriobacteriia bacterium]|nr:glucose-6-phosphate isomerase [Coriobacteriia bacterium]